MIVRKVPLYQKFVFTKGFTVSMFDNMGLKNEDLKGEVVILIYAGVTKRFGKWFKKKLNDI